MIDSVYEKNEYCYPKVFLEKYSFDKDIEMYSNNSYFVESDEEYYNEKCIDLFIFRNNKKNAINLFLKNIRKKNFFLKLGTLKFPPESF